MGPCVVSGLVEWGGGLCLGRAVGCVWVGRWVHGLCMDRLGGAVLVCVPDGWGCPGLCIGQMEGGPDIK